MLSFRKPSALQLERFLAKRRETGFTYQPVGVTQDGLDEAPRGYALGHSRALLASGEEGITEKAFAAGKMALQRWQQFRLGWVEAWPNDTDLRVGEVVAIVAQMWGLRLTNACRIVAVIDEPQGMNAESAADRTSGASPDFVACRFGFVYGTLPGHVAAGEERFLIEADAQGNVWFDILAFSRPDSLLAKVGAWQMRRTQARFRQESTAEMQRFVNANC